MGKPVSGGQPSVSLLSECIGQEEQTQGTETSKYLEEKKSTETPSVAASERGSALSAIGRKDERSGKGDHRR
jgi:hypothetical protein